MSKRERVTAELKLRVPETLRAKIEKAAQERGVSLNAEMINRLDSAVGRGLLEEIFLHVYGEDHARALMIAAEHKILKLTDEDIERMVASIRDVLVKVQKGKR